MKAEISIPESLSEVKLINYIKLLKIIKENPEADQFIAQKTIEYICEIPPQLVSKIKYKDFNDLVSEVNNLFDEKAQLTLRFKHKGIEFGFIPKLDDLQLGEFVDLTTYFSEDWEKMDRAMAVLYRPVTKSHKDQYSIEEYEGSEKYAETLKDMPLSIAMGAYFFFHNLGIELSRITLNSLSRESKEEETALQQILEQNGVGISHFTHSLEGLLYELKMPKN